MKRLYEGASALSVAFFLIIVVGGFIFGTKIHNDKSRHRKELREKVNKTDRYKDKVHKKELESVERELEYLKKMNDPLWHYYDEESDEFLPIPGKYNVDIPKIPRKYSDD